MNDWDRSYRETSNVFGADPAPILDRHADLIELGPPILDVGCGQGRNSFYLARRGHEHRHGDGPVERHGLAEGVFRTS